MTDQHFTIPGRLAGANEFIGGANRHYHVGGRLKKRETAICAACCRALRPVNGPVMVQIRWFEKDLRRDIDNVAFGVKFILDGLRAAGKLPNDGRLWVRFISHDFPPPDKKSPRVEVTLTEIEEAL